MKKLLAVLLVVALLATGLALRPVKAEEVKTIKIFIGKTDAYVNNTKVTLDQPPVIINGRTMVPIRFVSENLGATVDWNAAVKEATITLLENKAILTVDKAQANANGYTVYLDAPATIVKSTGRTIVPIRFVGDTLGCDVIWNGTEKSVTIKFSEDWIKNPVEVPFWHAMQADLGKALQGLIDEFNATHPRYKIVGTAVANYTGLQQKTVAALSAKNPPLLTQAYENWVAQYMLGSYLTPMENYVNGANGLSQNEKNDFYEIMWRDGYMPDGKFWMMPFNKSTEVMYYNVDMLKAYGFDHPPKTWDEFTQMCKTMTKEDNTQWGSSFGSDVDLFYAVVYAYGGEVISSDYKKVMFDKDPNALAAVKMLNSLFKNGYAHFTTGYNYQTDFGSGKCAFVFASVASYTYMKAAVGGKFNFAEAPLPAGPRGQVGVMYGTNVVMFGVKYSKEVQDGAWAFVKWFTEARQTARWSIQTGYLPVRKSALEVPEMKEFISAHPEAKAGFEQLQYCIIQPPTKEWNTARTDIGTELQKIFLQKISPEDGIKELGEKIRSYIKGY